MRKTLLISVLFLISFQPIVWASGYSISNYYHHYDIYGNFLYTTSDYALYEDPDDEFIEFQYHNNFDIIKNPDGMIDPPPEPIIHTHTWCKYYDTEEGEYLILYTWEIEFDVWLEWFLEHTID